MQTEAARIIIVMAFSLLREDANILLREREDAQILAGLSTAAIESPAQRI
ncbi:MAG TPA: hypothetical protein VFE08_15300 [Candidatus Sulfotelmatobacter sp.]|jgi:hypothetical protein|nr:hypothetical protein [Candidatus Sulfotelmatobacter sp.]